MKLYVCYGTFKFSPRPGLHPCGRAYRALRAAGHDPEVVRCYGAAMLPGPLNNTPGRKHVRELTGNDWVPMLELDDGSTVQGSNEIEAWAAANVASGAAA